MAITAERVQIIVEAEVQKALDGLKKTDTATNKLFTTAKKLIGPAALAGVAIAAVRVGKEFSNLAADAEEVNSKFNTVFKDQADSVREWATTYSTNLGQSSTDTLAFLATIQDTLVPLGFARDAASDMSTEIVALAGDLASFNNLPTADVVRDIQSAVVGNTETLRKYGVVASMAAIQQEALNSGIIESKRELTAQEKAQAILNITLAGTVDAQGDLERTQDSAANTTRRLENATKDLGIAIGNNINEGLTPMKAALTEVVTGFTELIVKADEAREAQKAYEEGVATNEQKLVALNARLELQNQALERANGIQGARPDIIQANIDKINAEITAIENRIMREEEDLEFARRRDSFNQEAEARRQAAAEDQINDLKSYSEQAEFAGEKTKALIVANDEWAESLSSSKQKNDEIITSFREAEFAGTTYAEVLANLEVQAEETGKQFAATAGSIAEGFGQALAAGEGFAAATKEALKSVTVTALKAIGEEAAVRAAFAAASLNFPQATAFGAASLAAFTAAGAVSAFANGGDFTTNGPQLIMVGDNPGGRERVQVTPESSPNINGPQGLDQMNIYIDDSPIIAIVNKGIRTNRIDFTNANLRRARF